MSGAYLPAVGERLPDWRIGPFDAAALTAYAEASGDANPLHLDDALARAIGFPAPPVHGMKLLAAFEPLLSAWRRDLFLARLSGKFVQPVLRGEAVTLTARVLRSSPEEGVFLRLLAYGETRAPAIVGEALMTLPRKLRR
ncbi:enoyl-CoA hydratase [Methylosinus sp. C49]|uniref:MaoC family dehydratase n=1 Tax=Methylosinus sp. C49 TaxID=2699395 RepID=UPI0013673975|nr:MaoC family dehydratase [Methylosinus sp. C49]BBU63648.1 enoyl-CoA hydratase [Methylosinus sp. C49]